MKKVVLGVLTVAGVLMLLRHATFPPQDSALAQHPSPPINFSQGTDSGLIAFSTDVDDQYQQITVIDPKIKVFSVYQVSLETGNVKLCCVRKIEWDLQMTYFNGEDPLPPKIRDLQQQLRQSPGEPRTHAYPPARDDSKSHRSEPF